MYLARMEAKGDDDSCVLCCKWCCAAINGKKHDKMARLSQMIRLYLATIDDETHAPELPEPFPSCVVYCLETPPLMQASDAL